MKLPREGKDGVQGGAMHNKVDAMDGLIIGAWRRLVERAREHGLVDSSEGFKDHRLVEDLVEILDGSMPDEAPRRFLDDPEVVRDWSYLSGVADALDATPTTLLDDVDWEED